MTHAIIYIADVEAWTGSEVETLRISTHTIRTSPFDDPPSVLYSGIISDIGVIDRAIFEGTATLGNPSMSEGYIELTNTGDLDSWINYGFDGRAFSLYRMTHEQYGGRVLVFTGTLLGLDTSNAWTKLRLIIRDGLRQLEIPLLTERYGGTTTGPGASADGTPDMVDQVKPWAIGNCHNVTPKLVNPYDLIYQVSFKPVDIIHVLVAGVSIPVDTNVSTLEELVAYAPVLGHAVTCVELGLFKTGSNFTSSVITCEVVHTLPSGSNSSVAVVRAILEEAGFTNIDEDSFTEIEAVIEFIPVAIFIDNEDTVLEICNRVLDSVGLALVNNLTGQLSLAYIREPDDLTPVADFDADNIKDGSSISLLIGASSDGEGIPAWAVNLHYKVNFTLMTREQIAGGYPIEVLGNLISPYLTLRAEDVTVLDAHPMAVEITKDTFIELSSTEANRLLALYSVRRDRIDVTLDDVDADGIELGDCVRLTINRFGYDSGKKFLVLGRKDEFRTRSVVLSLWG